MLLLVRQLSIMHNLSYGHYRSKKMVEIQPKLIFLHIPKTSGKSQRELFIDVYGAENVFWHGSSQEANNTSAVIGGHRTIKHYESLPRCVFSSIVRKPLDRVVSHFNWIAIPSYGKTEVSQGRIDLQKRFIAQGLVPDSLEQTLEGSEHFRNVIANTQCQYLSLYKSDFQGVIDTMSSHDFLIGTQDDLEQYTRFFLDLCGKPIAEPHTLNRATEGQVPNSKISETAKEILDELTSEDEKLYSYIRNECSGLYSSISKPEAMAPCRFK